MGYIGYRRKNPRIGKRNRIKALTEIGLRVFLSTTSERGRESPKIGRMKKRKGERERVLWGGGCVLPYGGRGSFHKLPCQRGK